MGKQKKNRDVEKRYPKKAFIAKLRRLADALENDRQFSIQIVGERVHVPVGAIISIEHERGIEGDLVMLILLSCLKHTSIVAQHLAPVERVAKNGQY